jgi:hypothetical protein
MSVIIGGPLSLKLNILNFTIVKVRFLWNWTYLSLQCEGPFSLKLNILFFTMWRSIFSENEHPYPYNVKVRFLWKWTCLSLQCEGPFSLKMNKFIFTMWRSVFSATEHMYLYMNVYFSWNWNELYNVKVRFLLIWTN